MLKEFRGHASFVNHAIYCDDYTKIISASSDGSVKVWDFKTGTCLRTVLLYQGKLGSKGIPSPVVMHLTLHPTEKMNVIVADRSPYSYIITLDGDLIKSFHLEKPADAHFVSR
jgi:WD40 repeat-containing protein SMU1